MKARLYLRIIRNGETVHTEDIFGMHCLRDGSQKQKSYKVGDPIVDQLQINDKLIIMGVSGGGGGHQLRVMSMKVQINAIDDD